MHNLKTISEKMASLEDCFKSFSALTDFTFSVLSFLVGVLTLYLAFRIYKKFGKNHITTKQIDHVASLIQVLNDSGIELTFFDIKSPSSATGTGHPLKYNVFEIAAYDKFDSSPDRKKYDYVVVTFDKSSNQLFNIKSFITHPLTPKSIADELLNFHATRNSKFQQPIHQVSVVEVKSGFFDPKVFTDDIKANRFTSDARCMKSWHEFKLNAKNLKSSIENWLKKVGIEENNIRQDFKSVHIG
jgi:hypothetical protein